MFLRNLFGRAGEDPRAAGGHSPYIPAPSSQGWDLDSPLLYFSPADPWTLRDSFEGVQVFGGIGSGKTSGSGAALARAMLAAGYGGLVMCAKPGERALWERYAAATGRSHHLAIVRPGEDGQPPRYQFNFLDYELRRPGEGAGQTENLVHLITSIAEIAEGKAREGGGDSFFDNAMEELVANAVDVLALAGEPLSLDAICRLIAEGPQTQSEAESETWQHGSFTGQAVQAAFERARTERERHDAVNAARYWSQSFPRMGDRTRGSVVATFTGVANRLTRGLGWELLCSGLTIFPEVAFEGYLIILDLPVQEYGKLGRTVQGIWKHMFQQAVLRRDVAAYPRPVFLWADEAQYFVSSYDFTYQSTVRDFRGATVYLTQNVSNYLSTLGGDAKASVDSLLGNLSTKIFHANSDHLTNTYAADTIAQRREMATGGSTSTAPDGQPGGSGASFQQSDRYPVMPAEFITLAKGGPQNGGQVEAFIFKSGRQWRASGETFLKAVFLQG